MYRNNKYKMLRGSFQIIIMSIKWVRELLNISKEYAWLTQDNIITMRSQYHYNQLLHVTVTSSEWVQPVSEADGQEFLVP